MRELIYKCSRGEQGIQVSSLPEYAELSSDQSLLYPYGICGCISAIHQVIRATNRRT